ncbi:hypothetical protein LaP1706_gp59 [Lactococcus phage 1706]|uniref:Uncharacterized protein n=1 Tax=Lactococcus phage 1706 TaxID=475178 RepID=B2BTM3_9CAUD|nr:hypothetical protein LaP1706_gp59 [Lactococcus phage 1706]ABV91266.1 unknown [Lactococcus phage 1706]
MTNQEPLNTVKKYIEDAIGTIKHDGHLGTIQTDLILPDLEKALAAIGTTGFPAGLIGTNGLTDENFIEVFELRKQNAEFTRENNIVNQINSKLVKENVYLKSQLQQQDLPVVPEDVDKAIKYLKTQNNFATLSDFDDILTEKGFWWLNDFQFKDRRFGFGGLNNKLFILSHLAITGYTVEKPQDKITKEIK